MKRITDQKTELAKNALLECIEKTAGIEDKAELNKQAFDVLYKHLGDHAELLKERAKRTIIRSRSINWNPPRMRPVGIVSPFWMRRRCMKKR